MKTYIALVRHGVTDWNYDGRAQGHTDIPLNAEGLRQAEAVAVRLATERWNAVYSSDLGRAMATAQAICQRTGHSLIIEPRLRERSIGLAEGTTPVERQIRWPGVAWNSLPGMETDEQVAGRAMAVLSELARRHEGGRLIVVAHGGIIGNFLRKITGGTTYVGVSRNTGVSPVLFDGERFSLAGHPDHRHLLLDGIEYSAEKGRILSEVFRSGLPGTSLAEDEIEPFVLNATAMESAWFNDQLVGYARAFTDRIRFGYVDMVQTLPEFQRVKPVLLYRLEQRFPGIRFHMPSEMAQERSGA